MIYENIVKLCKDRGISIAKLEQKTGLGNGTIGKWGTKSPNVDNVKKVADFFGVTVDSLLSAGAEVGEVHQCI